MRFIFSQIANLTVPDGLTNLTVLALDADEISTLTATAHQYIELDLRSKEKILHKLKAPTGKIKRFKPTPQVLKFLENL